ncbi:stimulated by retinoic acid gene 6 protein-like isoform X2 [Halichondria panicea]|uniref:stimulated by retinoic acid gene 6 protein-like isoform X2 n=1 Tax=Halichondria panicea TaxID=6063 RepID=UPI00312B85F8
MDSQNTSVMTEVCLANVGAVAVGYLGGLLGLSVVILIVLGFIQRRKKLHGCLWGFPGLVKPMDFLVAPRYRFIYIIIFGVMSQSLFTTFQVISTPAGVNFYLGIVYRTLITPLLVVLILSLQYFPLFACVNAPIPLLGHIIGLIYSILWCGYIVMTLVVSFSASICQDTPALIVTVLLHVASIIPTLGVAIIVVIWYSFKVVQGLLRLCRVLGGSLKQDFVCCGDRVKLRATDPPKSEVKSYHLLHIKRLLQKSYEDDKIKLRGRTTIFLTKIAKYIFPYSKDFRLPLPFVGAVFAMCMILYQSTIITIIRAASLATDLPPVFDLYVRPLLYTVENATIIRAQTMNFTIERINSLKILFSGIDEVIGLILVGLPAFLCVCPVVSLVFCLCLMINMVATVSKQLKRVAKEGFKIKLPSPGRRVPSSWKYVGHLIGFFTLAWFIYTFVVFLVFVVVALLYLGFRFLREFSFEVVLYIFIPLVWSQLVLVLQTVICRFVFFEDQKGSFIAIKNRRLFNWFAYILFFYNGIAGFVSAILRTLMSVVFSLLLLFRLDQVVLIRGFEQFDFAHNAYLGFIYLNSTYNNAVMHVFLYLLKKDRPSPPPSVFGAEQLELPQQLEPDLSVSISASNKLFDDGTVPRSKGMFVVWRDRGCVTDTVVVEFMLDASGIMSYIFVSPNLRKMLIA